jgi:flagellin
LYGYIREKRDLSMTLNFNSNISAMAIGSSLNKTSTQLQKSLQRLATGLKINSAADGAAAMAIGVTMDSQIRGYGVASSNVQVGLGMLNIAESGMQDVVSHLQNLRDIAVAASNSTNTTAQFSNYQNQAVAEIASINNIANGTKYDANILLDGSMSGGAAFNIQTGANSGDALDIKTAFTDHKTATLAVTQSTIASTANAGTLLTQVDAALATVTGNLATVGGFQNRLNDTLNFLSIAQTNVSASQASIRNTDVAQETANVARLQILQSAGAYALAQANTQPQIALQLLPR